MMLNRILNGRVVLLMTSVVHKKITVFIRNDAESNALSNEDKLSIQYFQKRVYFDQILNHLEHIKDPKRPI
jgi:hypothetical protein